MIPQRILVSLDCLLDTRLATVSLIDDTLAKGLLNNFYRHRLHDNFELLTAGALTNEKFKQSYNQRNTDTLKKSLPTQMFYTLNKISSDLRTLQTISPHFFDKQIVINQHPYILTEEEKEAFIECVKINSGEDTKVEIIDRPLNQITPQYIKVNFDCVILYEFEDWLKEHMENLTKVKSPRVTMFYPAISFKGEIAKMDITIPDIGVINPFDAFTFVTKEFMNFEPIDSAYFSIADI